MPLCAVIKLAHELFPLEVPPPPSLFPPILFLSLLKFLGVRRRPGFPPPSYPLLFEMYRWQNNGELPRL